MARISSEYPQHQAPPEFDFSISKRYTIDNRNRLNSIRFTLAALPLIDHKCGHLFQECLQCLFRFCRKGRISKSLMHELHPTVAGGLVDLKRKMPCSQARMPTLFYVARRASKAINQEVAQPLLGAFAVFFWVHGAKNLVPINLAIKSRDEPRESLLPNKKKNLVFIHRTGRESSLTRDFRRCDSETEKLGLVAIPFPNTRITNAVRR